MNRRLYFAIALLSSSMIAFQLSLMNLLSVTQWNHFAYMVISIALLGFGSSGTLIAITKNYLLKNIETKLFLFMLLTGLSMAGINILSHFLFRKFDSFLLFADKSNLFYLFLAYLIFFLPFLFGATAIGLSYFAYVEKINFLYFADLFGSGIAGLGMLGLLWIVNPATFAPLISILPIIAAVLIMPDNKLRSYIPLVLIILFIPVYLIIKPFPIPVSEFKSISKTLNLPETNILYEKSSPYGYIQLLRSKSLRYAPGLSLSYTEDIPVRDMIFCNGNYLGPVINWTENDSTHFMDYTSHNLPFIINPAEKILIPESGTGLFATHALSHKAASITLSEENRVVLNLLNGWPDRAEGSFLDNPKIKIVNKHPRSFLLSDTSKYDLIIFPTIETFGGSSGINALKEQYIYTIEAFQEAYEKLNEKGMISITTWIDYPLRNPLKILASFIELLDRENGNNDINKQLAVIRSWGTITYTLKKAPFTENEIEKIRAFCGQMYFDPLILPGISTQEKIVYNMLEDTSLISYFDLILSNREHNLFQDYDFQIQPSTDNKPYFSQYLKLKSLNKLNNLFGTASLPYLELGYFIVLFTFVQIFLIAFILIIFPLFFTGWKGGKKLYTFLHFSGIGIGFMFVEIIFIQKFILYFGNTIYSAAAVLSGILLCSGAGSLFSYKFEPGKKNFILIFLMIIICIIVYAFTLTPLIKATMKFALAFKILLSLIIISPSAFFMGMPFPLGLRFLKKHNKNMISWAWGVNGCMSVISTVSATIIAVEAGYFVVLILAALFYSLSLSTNMISRN